MFRRIKAPVFDAPTRVLRTPRLRDARQINRILRDPTMQQFVPTGDSAVPWEGLAFIVKSWLGRLRGRRLDYLVVDKRTGEVVSCWMSFRWDLRRPRSFELGTWRARKYWGAPRADDGLGFMLYRWLFREVGIHRIYMSIDPENLGAMKSTLLGTYHWTFEGTLRHAQFHHGDFHNMRRYSWLVHDEAMQRMLAEADARFPHPFSSVGLVEPDPEPIPAPAG